MTKTISEHISISNKPRGGTLITDTDRCLVEAFERLGKDEHLSFVFTSSGEEKTKLEIAERNAELQELFSYPKSALRETAHIEFEETPEHFIANVHRVLNEQTQAKTA